MHSPTTVVSTPEVVIGPDGVPRISPEYLDAYERFMQTIVTEDDTPVDNIFSAKQARLLIESLYASWTHPRFGRRFTADGNVGARMRVMRYVVYDPELLIGQEALRIYALNDDRLERTNETWFEQINLGITLWRGQFEGCEAMWLRWCDREGTVIPTGAERAEDERARAERLAARLRAAGIEPD